MVCNRGKKISRQPGAVLCGAESRCGRRGPHKGAAGPRRARGAGRGGEGCCLALGTGWKRPARDVFTYPPRYPGPGRLGWLIIVVAFGDHCGDPRGMVRPIENPPISIFFKGHQVQRRPWAISKRRHLDSSNLWCGRYRCSPGLTSLFGK